MGRALERDTYIENREHNPLAEAKSVVLKGHDGSSYPVINLDENGKIKKADESASYTYNGDGKVETITYSDRVVNLTWTDGKVTNKEVTYL